MRRFALALLISVGLGGCLGEPTPVQQKGTLLEARAGFKTKLAPAPVARDPVPEPPPELFRKVQYDAPAGKLAALVSQVKDDGTRHPAIIWITGGDCNTIDDLWNPGPPENDQTASAYRNAGIVMMFPSLRGGNDNPGTREGGLGEVDDVLAAADYLVQQPTVDFKRVYLGGHSTGGTLVLLVAECTDRFRAIFSFGPVSDVSEYDPQYLPFDRSNPREIELRSPGRWLSSIQGPTFVFEGPGGNISSLRAMSRATKNPMVRFHEVPGADHFSILSPTNTLIARKILADQGATTNIAFSEAELNGLMAH
jgi:acetyl esterase/lipase